MQYIDMHCDTLAKAMMRGYAAIEDLKETMVDIRRLEMSGAVAQFFAIFLPQQVQPEWADMERALDGEEMFAQMYQILKNTWGVCRDSLAMAYSWEDLKKNQGEGKISAFLTIENGYLVDGRLENLQRFYEMGVRLMTLTWNDQNCFGYPHTRAHQGLTDFGKEAVRCMNKLGMIVDVSHLSDKGFYDVAEVAKKPFVASHSNCRALCPATRNLTDEMIRRLAEGGGVVGVNFEPSFLNKEGAESRVEDICNHICHFIKIGGTECVGIGTDFDGISGEFEISECTKMEYLFDALHRRRISENVIEKIAFGNVERVIKDVMG